jgi:UDP-N-acetylmuramoylalanine--D-glutamate ligase
MTHESASKLADPYRLQGQRVIVAGLGVSGQAACVLALSRGAQVIAVDESSDARAEARAASLRLKGIEVMTGWNPSVNLPLALLVVLSPGIPPEGRLGKALSEISSKLIGELEFGLRHLPCPILAITGTNGKTTSTELAEHCLNGIGLKAVACGNIGFAASELAMAENPPDFAIAEVSSFQLDTLHETRFAAGVILNVTPDHWDRYPCPSDYTRSKLRLALISKRCAASLQVSRLPEAAELAFDLVFDKDGELSCSFRRQGDELILSPCGMRLHLLDQPLRGGHNAENLLAVLALGHMVGLDPAALFRAAGSFKLARHRQEEVLNKNGIVYINDSKSTNPDAMSQAILRFGREERRALILIAGGRDKMMDFSIVSPLLPPYVKSILTYGESATLLTRLWSDLVPCTSCESFDAAVEAAMIAARDGDAVLLSPGCASLDCFSSYAQRGDRFTEIVQRSPLHAL